PITICTLGRVKCVALGSTGRNTKSTAKPTAVPMTKPPARKASNCSIGFGLFSITTVIPMRNGSRLIAIAITRMVIHMDKAGAALDVQPGELFGPVQLDAGGAADLAARGGGNRAGGDEHQIGGVQPVRCQYRRADVLLDDAELLLHLVVGRAAFLELDDGDQFLGVGDSNRDRGDPAVGDLLDRGVEVLG